MTGCQMLFYLMCFLLNGIFLTAGIPEPVKTDPTASWQWVPASNGAVPPNAVVGGSDNGNLYIARANHQGNVMAGKLYPPHGCAYVPWGGLEYCKTNYEVLCNANGKFIQTTGSSIPSNAYTCGYNKIDKEPLYIGRVSINGTLTIGKVSRKYGACFVPYGGKEHVVTEYEIYVSQ